MITLGLDEAGRGPVVGPLVCAGVWLTDEQADALLVAGVSDSKQLTAKRREVLYDVILAGSTAVEILVLQPEVIDAAVRGSLNLTGLEMQTFCTLVGMHACDCVILDAPSINAQRVAEQLRAITKARVVAEHKADTKYVSVGAASVIAKVVRDRALVAIEQDVGVRVGSGYPADPVTRAFVAEHGVRFSSVCRQSWKTYSALTGRFRQQTL